MTNLLKIPQEKIRKELWNRIGEVLIYGPVSDDKVHYGYYGYGRWGHELIRK